MTESETQARRLGYSVKYRGRGYGHLTGGHAENEPGNYKRFGEKFGVDLVNHPEKAAEEGLSAQITVNQLTVTPSRPTVRGGKHLWWTLKDFDVKEGGTASKLAIGWVEARAMHNTMNDKERTRSRPMEQVAKKIYAQLGGKYAK